MMPRYLDGLAVSMRPNGARRHYYSLALLSDGDLRLFRGAVADELRRRAQLRAALPAVVATLEMMERRALGRE